MTQTKIKGYSLRKADEADIPMILGFIKELAGYENMLDKILGAVAKEEWTGYRLTGEFIDNLAEKL